VVSRSNFKQICIPIDIHRGIKMYAKKHGLSMAQVVVESVKAYIGYRMAKEEQAKYNAIKSGRSLTNR